jgi:hypothetical protein
MWTWRLPEGGRALRRLKLSYQHADPETVLKLVERVSAEER